MLIPTYSNYTVFENCQKNLIFSSKIHNFKVSFFNFQFSRWSLSKIRFSFSFSTSFEWSANSLVCVNNLFCILLIALIARLLLLTHLDNGHQQRVAEGHLTKFPRKSPQWMTALDHRPLYHQQSWGFLSPIITTTGVQHQLLLHLLDTVFFLGRQ